MDSRDQALPEIEVPGEHASGDGGVSEHAAPAASAAPEPQVHSDAVKPPVEPDGAKEAPIVALIPFPGEARTFRPADSAAVYTDYIRKNVAKIGLAAAMACLVVGAAAWEYDHARDTRLLTAKIDENRSLTSAMTSLGARIDAIESARGRDETTDLRKVLGELKSGASATRDFGSTLAQLSQRVDHIEKDQGARLDKLGERIDHDNSTRLADVVARLDKMEKKAAAPVVVAVATSAPPATAKTPTPLGPPAPPTKSSPGVSNETTGAIEKPRPRLHGYNIEEVRDGFAVVDSRLGAQPVGPGDFIPGAGRVLRIERQGHDWAVVTTLGVITADLGSY